MLLDHEGVFKWKCGGEISILKDVMNKYVLTLISMTIH